jgi:glycosyltransferase involved in cell wall biosynthesis
VISFIVPAFNEEVELPGTLRALRAAADAAGEPYEIVVADDASTDSTAEIARAAGARLLQVHRRQIAAVRNAGACAARGDVLFFVDADTHIEKEHVTGGLRALEEGFVGGGAFVRLRGELPGWVPVFAELFTALYFRLMNLGAGGFLFTSRASFERVGGFDEQWFAGEEVYFTQALKKLGRFKLLREPVHTSGRKVRMHSGWYLFRTAAMLLLRGPGGIRSREKLDLWYDGKRESRAA